MYKATVKDKNTFQVELDHKNQKVRIDDKNEVFEIFREHKNILQVLKNNKTFSILILKYNPKEKTATIKVNENRYEISLKDKYDELLIKLGFDTNSQKKVNTVKAPMPGMVLNVLVDEGNLVKKGDALVVLEAMKMENILKSPSDGTIKKISVKKGTAVEKNQVLIEF